MTISRIRASSGKKPRTPVSQRRRNRDQPRDNKLSLETLTAAAIHDIQLHTLPMYVDEANALRGSALTIGKRNAQDIRRLIQPWQAQSMSYYSLVPEVKFGTNFFSQMLRNVRLFPAKIDPETHEPTEVHDGPAFEIFNQIVDPSGGRAQLQEQYAKLRFLIGECYMTVSPDEERGEVWECLSPNELRPQPGGLATRFRAPMLSADQYTIGVSEYIVGNDPASIEKYGEVIGPAFVEDGPDIINVYRLWRPSPAYSWLADCNMQAALDILDELVLSTYSVRAQLKSRLYQAGVFAYPDEATLPSLGNDPEEDPASDDLMARLNAAIMASLRDPGTAAAVSPIGLRMAAEYIDKIKYLRFNDNQGELAEIQQRTEMIGRYATCIELPKEVITGTADVNHWGCVDTETEILTRDRGWITQEHLNAGDEVLTLDHESGMSEWQCVIRVNRFDVQEAEMLAIEGRSHSSLTTLNHRWPTLHKKTVKVYANGGRMSNTEHRVRHWTTSEDVNDCDIIIRSAKAQVPEEESWTDALVELMAWTWTEGSLRYREGRLAPQLHIYQSHRVNPENVERIRSALTRLYGPAAETLGRGGRGASIRVDVPRWRETRRANGMTIFKLNVAATRPFAENAPNRIVKREFVESLTAHQLSLFVDTSIRGDGHVMQNATLTISQKSKQMLDAIELAAILLGRPTRLSKATFDGFTRHTAWNLTIGASPTFGQKTRNRSRQTYTGIVWCPTTPNGSWLARRKGAPFFTGNSWLIDQQTYDSYGRPGALEMAADFTAAYFQPALRGDGQADWDQYLIGVDPADVINHPDRAKDAKSLRDAGLISDSVYREVLGYNDDDAMSTLEYQHWAGIELRDASYFEYGIPSVRANIEPAAGDIESATGEVVGTNVETGTNNGPGPPPEGPTTQPSDAGPVLQASAASLRVERILGAADFAIERGREMAGSRLRSLTGARGDKRCEECQQVIAGVPNSMVAVALGKERAKPYLNTAGPGTTGNGFLVVGLAEQFGQVLAGMGVQPDWAAELGDLIEQHAAKTLFQTTPDPLPAGFAVLLQRIDRPLERS